MKTLITGSMAFDTIMVFEDQFKNHILPELTHILNVSFLTPEMKRFEGGCAGNIAYNLHMLGGDPVMMTTVGEDIGPYLARMEELGLVTDHITMIPGQFTAQMFATTDLDHNQINAFHPGAMNFSHHNKVSDVAGVELGIVSPDGRDGMIQHAQQFSEAGIPFFFDPGQGLPMFDGDDLNTFLSQATYAIVNDYECQMIVDKTGSSETELAAQVDAFVVTLGAQGSRIHVNGEVVEVASAPIGKAVDPTGCGDAYRAGMLFGLAKGLDWKQCGQVGALCGAIKIEHSGTQSHQFTVQAFAERYNSAFGEAFPVS
ncbi:MAG: carbohydrate kinase family protein [Pseudomonadota bacterium]